MRNWVEVLYSKTQFLQPKVRYSSRHSTVPKPDYLCSGRQCHNTTGNLLCGYKQEWSSKIKSWIRNFSVVLKPIQASLTFLMDTLRRQGSSIPVEALALILQTNSNLAPHRTVWSWTSSLYDRSCQSESNNMFWESKRWATSMRPIRYIRSLKKTRNTFLMTGIH